MTDPLSLIALGAAIGGAAGKFVEKAWDSGEKWITSYFENHHEKSQEKAKQNTLSFLTDLAKRVESLEKEKIISSERIASSQEHPDFSVVLQKAMISASQTDRQEKHQLLSRLVAERIKASPESIIALASKMACDAISYATSHQLKILGLTTNILYIGPDKKLTKDQYDGYLKKMINPFMDLKIGKLDFLHLESLSCLKVLTFLGRDLKQIITRKVEEDFDYNKFTEGSIGKFLIDIWNKQRLSTIELTSIGQIIGIMVSDQVTGTSTSMVGWE